MEYLETYGNTCEYFYLSAKKFSKSTLELDEIGLFDLTEMKVIKNPAYLFPDPDFRAHLMKTIKNNVTSSWMCGRPISEDALEFY